MPPSGIADSELANGESPDYYREMDRRLIVLETRFDTTLPMLATKTDLLELKAELKQDISELGNRMITSHGDIRAEMRDLKAEMHKWMTTTMISLLVGFGSMLVAVFTVLRNS